MMKILGRILIVLLVTAIIGAAVFFIAGGAAQTSVADSTGTPVEGQGHFPQGSGNGMGPGQGTGSREGGEGGTGFSSQILIGLGKNLSIIALVTVVIAIFRKVFSHKRVQNTFEVT
jgi:hypothetical protein